MKVHAAIVVYLIVWFMGYVKPFQFIRDILRSPGLKVNGLGNDIIDQALIDDYVVLDTLGLVRQHGYPVEQHKITTDDGYNIIFFRIPGCPERPSGDRKLVVFMQHGLISSSDIWVLFGPNRDLAFLLADAGYDVWLGNTRGNPYGRSHKFLSPTDPKFWNFSFHEMSTLDLPKMIDYVLQETGQKSLFYIGHSLGTVMSYVLLSEMPEYNNKMHLVVSFAPVGFWKDKFTPLYKFVTAYGSLMKKLFNLAGIYELFPQTKSNIRLSRAFCSDDSLMQPLCISFISMLAGKLTKETNITMFPYIAAYYPSGSSLNTFQHLVDNVNSGVLQKFDFGETENVKIYGNKEPPIYNLEHISAPVALIYGKNDAITIESNTVELAKQLPNVVALEAVPYGGFNHLDFLWATHAKELLYERTMEMMSMYGKPIEQSPNNLYDSL